MTPQSPVLVNFNAQSFEKTLGVGQPEYEPLPVLRSPNGVVTMRYKLTLRERLRILFKGNLYLQQLTFRNGFQPIKPSVEEPLIEECL